jgi:hypothetical protein
VFRCEHTDEEEEGVSVEGSVSSLVSADGGAVFVVVSGDTVGCPAESVVATAVGSPQESVVVRNGVGVMRVVAAVAAAEKVRGVSPHSCLR